MPNTALHAEKLENEGTQSVIKLLAGAGGVIVSLLILYFFQKYVWSHFLAYLGIVASLYVAGAGAYGWYKAKKLPTVPYACPYCEMVNRLLSEPTEDFECFHCSRVIHFDRGKPVPVHVVICQACHAEHKVSVKTVRYVCDKCNRPLRLTDAGPETQAVSNDALLRNYDVLLTAVGRNPTEVAMRLQTLLVTNLPEARRMMQSLPLVVVRNVPERKADAVRRQLQELGASVAVTPTQTR